MNLEVRKNSDHSWTLLVNGEATVQRESFAVVDRVRHALEHPEEWEPHECHEVADRIREHFRLP